MEKFEVINSLEDDVAVMNIRGFLDAHTAPLFEQELQKRVSEKKYKIVVDLEGLQYISSAGLGVFMGFIEEIRENGGDIKICCATPKVYRVFDLLGFPNLFEFTESRQDAVAKFNNQ